MILDDIVARKRLQLAEEASAVPVSVLERKALDAPPVRDFEAALRKPGLSVVAEVKKASPSKGLIAPDFRPVETALAYVDGGTDCISVLTERHFFQGSDEVLQAVRRNVPCPVLRKDFLLCERQVIEARAIGADAVLLIAAILDDATLVRLLRLAGELGMSALLEAHTCDEAKRLVQAGGRIIGVNNRNLGTFAVDLAIFGRVRREIPADCVTVAESGIAGPDDARRLRQDGCDAILVGETLMRSGAPARALAALKQ